MEKIVKNIFVSWTSNNKVEIEKYMNAISKLTKLSYYLSDYDCIGDFEQWFKDEINNAPFFLVYITKESLDKEFVKKEVEEIIAKYKKYNYKFITFISEVTSKKINQLDKDHHFYKLINECKVSGVFTENKTFDETIKEISEKIEIMTKQYDLLEYSNRLEKDLDRFKLLANTSFQSLSDFFTQRVLIDEFEQQEVDYDNLINKKKVLIRGEAGSGKSLYIQHLASILNKTSNVFILENNEVQEMISSNSSIISYLYKEIKATLLQEDDFKILMKRATNYLMIEGLDEVISNNKIKLLEKINQFTNEYDNFNVIFTSRNNEDISGAFKVKLLPLDEEKIQETAKKYICFYSNNEEKQHNFYLALNDINEEIKNNPLLLSQLAYIYSITNTLPNNKLDLYDEITSLFVKERNEDNIEVNLNDVIKDFIKNNRKILSKCAYKLVINKDNKDYTFLKALSTCLDNEDDANEVYKYLKARSIINIKDEFYHKTFLEYFASSYIFIKDNGFYEEDDIDGLIPTNKLIKLISKEDISDLYEMMLLHVDSKCEEEGIKQSIQVLIKDTTKYFYLLNILKQRNIFAKYLLKPLFEKVVKKEEHPYHELLYYTVKNNLYVELLLLAKETNNQELNYMYAFIQDIICLYSDINIKDYEDLYLDNINNIKNDGTKRYQNLIDYYVNGNTDVYFYYEDDEYNIYKENDNKLIGHIIINRQNQLQGKVTKKIIGLSIIDHENFHEEFDSYYKKTIKCFILPKGSKSTKNDMFYRCDSLTNVIIPEGVISIGDSAFEDCISLTSVVIPDSVINIGDSAFRDCTSLTSVVISDSVISIGTFAFHDCSSLINVYYKGTIENWCRISFIDEDSNPMYYAEHFYMLDENDEWYEVTTIEIPNTITKIGNNQFYGFNNVTSIMISSSVISIGFAAFYGCIKLESIKIPTSVINIENFAFGKCSNLSSITIPSSIQSIGLDVFEECSNLNEIFYDGTHDNFLSISVYDNLHDLFIAEDLYKYYFKNQNNKWYNLNYINLSKISKYNVIRDKIYYNGLIDDWYDDNNGLPIYGLFNHIYMKNNNNEWYEITSINYMPEHLVTLRKEVFANFVCLRRITIANTIKKIECDAFRDCNNLINVYFKGTVEDWCNINFENKYSNPMYVTKKFLILDNNGDVNYNGNRYKLVDNIIITNKIKNIGPFVFYGCSCLVDVIFEKESQLISIGANAFAYCRNLTNIMIPKSINNIGFLAFEKCNNLTNVYYEGTIEDWCKIIFEEQRSNPMHMAKHFYMLNDNNEWYEVTKIEIPNTITSVGDNQFFGFNNITSVIIPSSVTGIGCAAFDDCTNLKRVDVDSLDTLFSITANSSPCINGADLYFNNEKVTEITIPNTITNVQSILNGCTSIEKVTISKNVISTEQSFYKMINLKTVVYEEGTSITSISPMSFCNCMSLIDINIPKGITHIEVSAFKGCSSLENITIPEGVEKIESDAFKLCSSLASIIIPSSVRSIGDSTFSSCESLTSVVIPDSVTSIGYYAFSGCSSLTSVTIPSSVTSIGDGAFSGCSGLTSVTILEGVTNIGSNVFELCSSLTSIVIPSSVISIGFSAFQGCNNIKKLIISENFLDEIENLFTSETILKKYRNKEYVIKDGMAIFE